MAFYTPLVYIAKNIILSHNANIIHIMAQDFINNNRRFKGNAVTSYLLLFEEVV